MKFDVIIDNPSHQPSDGGNDASAMPIYRKFVEQAKKLDPRPLVMITPSRWFFGGRGLGTRHAEMPHDRRIGKLVGYRDAGERLPGADLSGGVFYLLWERDYDGDRTVVNMSYGKGSERHRDLGREHGQRDGRGRPAHRDPVLPLPLGHALPGPQLR